VGVAFLYFGGLAFVVALGIGLFVATTGKRALLLVAVGALLAASVFAYAWLRAPHSAQDADSSCSDCAQWLGRWWEGWLVLFFGTLNWIGWTIGVVIARGLHAGNAARRDLRAQRGAH
jgi:hypothetical protein